jgi:hypothetical protein
MMPSDTVRHQQLRRIADQQSVATRLLTAAKQDTIKTQVTHALRDLDEAIRLLCERAHTSHSILQTADLLIETAEWRLTTVDNALKTFDAG